MYSKQKWIIEEIMSHFTNYCEIIPQHRKDVASGREDALGMIIQEMVQQLRDGSQYIFYIIVGRFKAI